MTRRPSSPRAAPALVAILTLASTLALAPAAADHTQLGVVFNHVGGNEWWVEMEWRGDNRSWGPPSVRDTGGEWRTMTRPSWAPHANFYVLSYHVEPGHKVQFRLQSSAETLISCWFTHPAGAESCDGTESGGFAATFRVTGNANRIDVNATGTQPVTRVEMHASNWNGGGWGGALPKLPNGSWGRSGPVPDGLKLMFTAYGPNDQLRADSACYLWPRVTRVECFPSNKFFGWFENVHAGDGNDSILQGEAHTSGGPALAGVQVRFDGGNFQEMTFEQTPAPWWRYRGAPSTGDHVAELRLRAVDGQVVCDEDGYLWPIEEEDEFPFLTGMERVVFAEPKGNAFWVQINTYRAFPQVVAVQASVNNGTWRDLPLQSYCDWAAGISAPDGSQVRFRAFYPNLTFEVSAPFTWPPPQGPDQSPVFDATFTNVKGNEWWIQASVSATGGTLARVDVQLNGGTWQPLTNRGWGWANSYHAPEGTIVRLRATSTTGATDLSGCYRWIAATPVACGGTPPTFDATFKNVRGNEWWVETDVTVTGGTLAGVDARVNGGSWIALTKQSWGSWAKSIHAPPGSTVEFRARATDGQTDLSSAYGWPPT